MVSCALAIVSGFLLVKDLLVLTTCYFDDHNLSGSAGETKAFGAGVPVVFHILGWRCAESGSEAPDFAEHALGISVKVSCSHTGEVLLDNIAARRRELVDALDAVLPSGTVLSSGAITVCICSNFWKASPSCCGWKYLSCCHALGDAVSDETAFVVAFVN